MKTQPRRIEMDAAALSALRQMAEGVDPRTLPRKDVAWLTCNQFAEIAAIEGPGSHVVDGRSYFDPRAILREVATILPAGHAALGTPGF